MTKTKNPARSTPPAMERRGHQRFPVSFPCYAELGGSPGWRRIGTTINISRSGLLMRWEVGEADARIPTPGETMTLDLELPQYRLSSRFLRFSGVVVRVVTARDQCPLLALAVAHLGVVSRNGKAASRAQRPLPQLLASPRPD